MQSQLINYKNSNPPTIGKFIRYFMSILFSSYIGVGIIRSKTHHYMRRRKYILEIPNNNLYNNILYHEKPVSKNICKSEGNQDKPISILECITSSKKYIWKKGYEKKKLFKQVSLVLIKKFSLVHRGTQISP